MATKKNIWILVGIIILVIIMVNQKQGKKQIELWSLDTGLLMQDIENIEVVRDDGFLTSLDNLQFITFDVGGLGTTDSFGILAKHDFINTITTYPTDFSIPRYAAIRINSDSGETGTMNIKITHDGGKELWVGLWSMGSSTPNTRDFNIREDGALCTGIDCTIQGGLGEPDFASFKTTDLRYGIGSKIGINTNCDGNALQSYEYLITTWASSATSCNNFGFDEQRKVFDNIPFDVRIGSPGRDCVSPPDIYKWTDGDVIRHVCCENSLGVTIIQYAPSSPAISKYSVDSDIEMSCSLSYSDLLRYKNNYISGQEPIVVFRKTANRWRVA